MGCKGFKDELAAVSPRPGALHAKPRGLWVFGFRV